MNVYHTDVPVGLTPTLLPNDSSYYCTVVFNKDVWVGGSAVAVGNGTLVGAGREYPLYPGLSWYAIAVEPAEADIVELRDTPVQYQSSGGLNEISTGISTMSRDAITGNAPPVTSGILLLSYFTPRRFVRVTKMAVYSSGAAGATPTLVRFGCYEIDSSGGGTLVGSTASDTTVFAAASTRYERAAETTFNLDPTKRYAMGVLVVTAAAMPTYMGSNVILNASGATPPRIMGRIGSQANLPATFVVGSVLDTTARYYGELLS